MTTRAFTDELPERIVFGVGTEERVAAELEGLGARRVLLLAQPHHRAGADRVAAALGSRAAGIFTEMTRQVPVEVAEAARRRAREVEADWVLAHGGGTAIGVAKAVALTEDVAVAAVPTTYAGSERTNIWGLTERGVKTTGRDDRVMPKLVIYDPALTAGLPVAMSLTSILNAMAHSVEALYAADASEVVRDQAEESLAPLLNAMGTIAEDPDSLEGRSEALYGAYLAATALGRASMGLHHKLCHVLGGSFGTPHAATHSVILPHVAAFNVRGTALARLQRALDHDDPASVIWERAKSLDVPTTLRELGLRNEDLPRAADLAMAKRYRNPRPFDRSDVLRILEDAFAGRRASRHATPSPSDG
jgi:maleylacetate reductase